MGCDPYTIRKVNTFPWLTNVPYSYEGGDIERKERLDDILPAGFLEWDSLHGLLVGEKVTRETTTPTPAPEPVGDDVASVDPFGSPIDVDDDNGEEVSNGDRRTKIEV